MKMRPQPSLRRVLDDLGATLLELVWGDAAAVDEPVLPRRALVLGVGIRSAERPPNSSPSWASTRRPA